MLQNSTKRATVKMKKPNPLFETWILQWIEEAKNKNPTVAQDLEKALESLRKFPLVLNSGKECLILEHFDTRLCVRIDRKLTEHKNSANSEGTTFIPPEEDEGEPKEKKKKRSSTGERKKKEYIPAYRSGAYALLVTLHKNQDSVLYKSGVSKETLIRDAQALSDASFNRPQRGTFYTAWSSMAGLIQKGLVIKKANKFSLSEEGQELSHKLLILESGSTTNPNPLSPTPKVANPMAEGKAQNGSSSGFKISSETVASLLAPAKPHGKRRAPKAQPDSQSSQSSTGSRTEYIQVELPPGTFEVILLVDSKEVLGGKGKDESGLVSGLRSLGVPLEVRSLRVGDFGWVARAVGPVAPAPSHELVLPFVVERKRMDDLARSIKDTRFHEQKFRLKRCGLDSVIYLIEGCGQSYHGLPVSHLSQAAINTLVNDDFIVKVTPNHKETIRYIATLTTILANSFRNKNLFSCQREDLPKFNMEDEIVFLLTFPEFSHDSGKTKNMRVKEMFVKQLVQAHGLSVEKAWAVATAYPSPAALIESLLQEEGSGPGRLEGLKVGPTERNLGQSAASLLKAFYTRHSFPNT